MKLTVKDMVLCSLFAALISISAYLSIPSPSGIPFSLQPLLALLAGAILGSKRGAISMTVYMLLGAVGLPVFSNGTGGMKIIVGPTGGYIFGFIIAAFIVGLIVETAAKSDKLATAGLVIAPFIGMLVIHAIGLPYFYVVMNFINGNAMNLTKVLEIVFIPYILMDLIKSGIVVALALSLVPRLKTAGVF